MKKFTTLSKIERKNLIQKVAFELGMRFDIIEKDIWVCYVLEKLFSIEELKGIIVLPDFRTENLKFSLDFFS